MTQKKTSEKTDEKPADKVTITLDRDITIAGEDKKKGDKVTLSKSTADWVAQLPKPQG